MLNNIEKKIESIVRSQEIIHDDKLSKIINDIDNEELSEDELDLVVAAAKPDYQKFLDYIKLREKDNL